MFGKRKKTKNRPPRSSGASTGRSQTGRERKSAGGKWLFCTLLAAALVGGVAAGMKALERRVLCGPGDGRLQAVRVIFNDTPQWMPAELKRRIAEHLVPPPDALDPVSLAADVYAAGLGNPWIGRLDHVLRRADESPTVAVVEVSCEFRKPMARIQLGILDAFVDGEGVRLPAEDVPKWMVTLPSDSPGPAANGAMAGRTLYFIDKAEVPPAYRPVQVHYVNVLGVQAQPPAVGGRWTGEDLAEGLKLAQLISSRPYANQITAVDVRNHTGRITKAEPSLRMYAQVNRGPCTDIRFGRFPAAEGDYVVSPDRKLSYLDAYCDDHGGRLAGLNSYLDLRYDRLHVSLN